MSEKEIRNKLGTAAIYLGVERRRAAYEALDADPDLVVLLQWLDAETKALYESEGHSSSMAQAHDETADYIESKLGIRLTDDGWEYTDE